MSLQGGDALTRPEVGIFIDLYIYIYIQSFRKDFYFILIYIICIPCFSTIHLKSSV